MVGAAAIRHDAHGKVTGEAGYPADRMPADALHAVVVFTDQPHARLVSLDCSAAEAVDGVVAVVTAADVPVNEYGLTMFDQPVLIGVEHTGPQRRALRHQPLGGRPSRRRHRRDGRGRVAAGAEAIGRGVGASCRWRPISRRPAPTRSSSTPRPPRPTTTTT